MHLTPNQERQSIKTNEITRQARTLDNRKPWKTEVGLWQNPASAVWLSISTRNSTFVSASVVSSLPSVRPVEHCSSLWLTSVPVLPDGGLLYHLVPTSLVTVFWSSPWQFTVNCTNDEKPPSKSPERTYSPKFVCISLSNAPDDFYYVHTTELSSF